MLGWVAVLGGAILITAAVLNQLLTMKKAARAAEGSQLSGRLAGQAEAAGEYIIAQGMTNAVATRWINLQNAAVDQTMSASDWTGSFSSFIRAFAFSCNRPSSRWARGSSFRTS
jgi:ABC-type protease/lipase transport system fused ATPase/permease subunit